MPEELNFILKIHRLFKKVNIKYSIIGGVAAGLRGIPRATKDIDLIAELSEEKLLRLKKIIKRAGFTNIKEIVGNTKDNLPDFLRIYSADKSLWYVDVAVAKVPLQKNMIIASEKIKIKNQFIPVVKKEDLIILKLISWRNIDRADIENIIMISKGTLNQKYILKVAEKWGIKERFLSMLKEMKS